MEQVAIWIGVATGTVGLAGVVGRILWRGFQYASQIHAVVSRELTPNGGSSMLDKLNNYIAEDRQDRAELWKALATHSHEEGRAA